MITLILYGHKIAAAASGIISPNCRKQGQEWPNHLIGFLPGKGSLIFSPAFFLRFVSWHWILCSPPNQSLENGSRIIGIIIWDYYPHPWDSGNVLLSSKSEIINHYKTVLHWLRRRGCEVFEWVTTSATLTISFRSNSQRGPSYQSSWNTLKLVLSLWGMRRG